MAFLRPEFLWALLSLAIPVIIHLFNFQRTEKIIFANTQLLTEVAQQTKKARQLKSWLLLALRMLALFCLVLAFAQPVWNLNTDQNQTTGTPQVAIYLDNSRSMFIGSGGKSAFDIGQVYARSIPGNYAKRGWYQLTTNQFDARHTWTSAQGLDNQLASVSSIGKSRGLESVLQKTTRQTVYKNLGDQKAVWMVTDFQKSALPDLKTFLPDSTLDFHLGVMEHAPLSNVVVDSIWLSKPISFAQKAQLLKISVVQSGVAYDKPVNLQLFANGALLGGKTIRFSGTKRVDVSLPFRIKPNEILKCTLRTDDPQVTFDNEILFTLVAPPPVRIYLIDDENNPFLKRIFKSQSIFIPYQSRSSAIDYQKLNTADLVVINQPQNLDDAIFAAVTDRLKAGASVLYIPDKQEKTSSQIQKFGLKAEKMELPDSKASEWKIKLPAPSDLFFSGAFSEVSPNASLPNALPYFTLSGGSPVLSYEAGTPYLMQKRIEAGKFFVLASAFGDASGNMARHLLSVPMLYKIAFSGSFGSEAPLFYRSSSPEAFVPIDSGKGNGESAFSLVKDNQKILVTQKTIGNRYRIELPGEDLQPGFWTVFKENQNIGLLAINIDKAESVMEFYSPDEIKEAFAGSPWVKVNAVSAEASPETVRSNLNESTPLWKYFVWLSLFMFASEMVWIVLSRSKKNKKA